MIRHTAAIQCDGANGRECGESFLVSSNQPLGQLDIINALEDRCWFTMYGKHRCTSCASKASMNLKDHHEVT